MNKLLLNIAAIMAAIVVINCFVKVDNTDEVALARVLDEDMYYDVESNVESAIYIGNQYMNDDERKEMLVNIAEGLGIKGDYDMVSENTDTGRTLILSKKAKSASTYIKLTTVERQVSNSQISLSQYLYTRMEFEGSPESAVYYKEKLDGILKKMGYNENSSVNYTGKCAGNLSKTQKNKITSDIIKNLSGKETDRVCTDDIYTVYGYSEYIPGEVRVDGRKTNFNLAFSYDENENVTILHISAPIITADY